MASAANLVELLRGLAVVGVHGGHHRCDVSNDGREADDPEESHADGEGGLELVHCTYVRVPDLCRKKRRRKKEASGVVKKLYNQK